MGTFGTTGELRRGLCILGVIAVMLAVAGPTSSRSFGPFELPVGVEEQPGIVRLRVHVPPGAPESSIGVRITAHGVVVHCWDYGGLPMRSREIPLSQAVSLAGAEAEFSADGTLVITLHAVAGGGP